MTAEALVEHDVAHHFSGSADPGAERPATGRFGLRPAPGGLALVQDFLNTGAQPDRFPDLFTGVPGARRWSMRAAGAWLRERGIQVEVPVPAGDDLSGLCDLRRRRGMGYAPGRRGYLGRLGFGRIVDVAGGRAVLATHR